MSEYESDFTQPFMRGICMISEREYEEAIKLFDQVIEIEPVHAEAYTQRAYAKFQLSRYAEALDDLNAAIEMSPASADAFSIRAQVYAAMQHYQESLEDITKALEIEPENLHALRVRAGILMQLDRKDIAINNYDKILEIQNDDNYARFMRAWAKIEIGRPEEGLEDNSVLLDFDPTDWKYLRQRLILLCAIERHDEVLAFIEQLPRLDPETEDANVLQELILSRKGETLVFLERHHEAIEAFESAPTAETCSPIVYGIAVAHCRLGNIEKCREQIEKALHLGIANDNSYQKTFYAHLLKLLEVGDSSAINLVQVDVATVHYANGMKLTQEEKYEEAIKCFDLALEYNPIWVGAFMSKAEVLQKTGHHEDALIQIETALTFFPDSEGIQYEKAYVLGVLERYTEAITMLSSLIQQDASNGNYYYQRARAHFFMNDYDKAIEDLDALLPLDETNIATLQLRASCHREMKNYDKAIEDYSRALYHHPDNAELRYYRAMVYEANNRYEEAIADANAGLMIAENSQTTYNKSPFYYMRALSWGALGLKVKKELKKRNRIPVKLSGENDQEYYHAEKCIQKAVDDFSRAIETDPGDSDSYWYRGYYYNEIKQGEQAVKDFSVVIEKNPDHASPYYRRGWCYIGLSIYQKAIDDFNMAIEIAPDKEENYYGRGIAKIELYQFVEAQEDLQKACDIAPNESYLQYYLGSAIESQGRWKEALPYTQKSVDLDPDNSEWKGGLVDLLIKMGRPHDAIPVLEKSIELDPLQSQPYYHLGEIAREFGDIEKADEWYRLAIRSESEDQRSTQEDFYHNCVYRGHAFARLGMHELALERYIESKNDVRNTDRISRYNFGIAESLYALKRYEEALDQYRCALEFLTIHHEHPKQIERCRAAIEEINRLLE